MFSNGSAAEETGRIAYCEDWCWEATRATRGSEQETWKTKQFIAEGADEPVRVHICIGREDVQGKCDFFGAA